ncbi:ABC transporter substrate-binding protein [Paracoccus sp. PARArs4]|uniref:ABC transporter substrate-binding protein n=1 Tax=Paracoccus sp. PARArs4 TaxID=2853442 RepID=UPI0024A66EDB|nr:ABC transporter substrate-binding protein [Paracoccus sp. PARArs4]
MIRSALLAVTAALCPLTALADDQTLDIAAPFELKGLDPALSGDIFLRLEIAETLVDSDAKGRLRPGLATEWTTSDDGLEWRFRIREGVAFHDGTMLDAAAAAISLNHARTDEGLLSRAPITDIRADGTDLVVALSEPFAILPAFLAEYRSQILAPASYDADGAVVALIGTGAFRTTEVSPPQTLAAERFEDYWDGAARIPALRYTAVTRSETRALMAESGDAELVVTLDPASVTRLSELEDLEVVSAPLPRVLMLKVDAASPFFDSAAEREALSMAIDRAGLAQVVLRYDASADQMFPPNMDGWHDAALPPLS